jgi:isocitrate dehydrogenase
VVGLGKKAAVIKGDGVGPEVIEAALKVLEAAGTRVELIPCEAGLEWWEKHKGNSFIPEETWSILKESDAVLKGPTQTPPDPKTPRSVAVSIRQHFDLYANVRPIKTLPGHVGRLGKVNFICVREATEGLYAGVELQLTKDLVVALRKVGKRASERIADFAFKLARDRKWRRVYVATKANILKESDGLFLRTVKMVSFRFPDLEMKHLHIDNIAQQLILNPQQFNESVLLSTNLYMDIISSEAAGLVGGIGNIYSANFGEKYAMFEPAHGTAPDIKGLQIANPTAAILSAAWMIEYLGEKELAQAIFQATEQVIGEGRVVTPDLGGSAKTMEMAEAVAERVREVVATGSEGGQE